MPNIIIMQVELGEQKLILGGYSSHGWLRDSSITQNINGKCLTRKILNSRYGFDHAFRW